MKIYSDTSLCDFEFWSGACSFANTLTDEQFDQLEAMLEDIAPEEGWSDTAINDLFWFEEDYLKELLGITDYPKYFRFDNKLGNDTTVSVEDEDEEETLKSILEDNEIDYQEVDENTHQQSLYEFDTNHRGDFLWNEDEMQYKLWVPEWLPACAENDDFSGLDDEQEKIARAFINEYSAADYDSFVYDMDDINFHRPDIDGANKDEVCVRCRIY